MGLGVGVPNRVLVDIEDLKLQIDGKTLDIALLGAICNPNVKILWRFVERDGVIRAVPYTEDEVIWIEKPDPRDEV